MVVESGGGEYDEIGTEFEVNGMDDNIWEYPFGDLDDDDEMFFHNSVTRKTSMVVSTGTNDCTTRISRSPNSAQAAGR
jgi:hypothetical protein